MFAHDFVPRNTVYMVSPFALTLCRYIYRLDCRNSWTNSHAIKLHSFLLM